MVTSFRPKDARVTDDSSLMTVRPVSDLDELYGQWTEYRVEVIEERCRYLVKKMRERKRVGRSFDLAGVKADIGDLVQFLEKTANEMIDASEYVLKDTDDEADDSRKRKRARN